MAHHDHAASSYSPQGEMMSNIITVYVYTTTKVLQIEENFQSTVYSEPST